MYKGGHVLKRLVSAGNDKRYIVNRGSNRPQDLVLPLPKAAEEETGVETERGSVPVRAGSASRTGNNNESKESGDIFFDYSRPCTQSSSCGEGGRFSSSGLDADTWDCEVSHAEISLSCTQDMDFLGPHGQGGPHSSSKMRACSKDKKSTYTSQMHEKVINETSSHQQDASSSSSGLSYCSEESHDDNKGLRTQQHGGIVQRTTGKEGGEAEIKKKEANGEEEGDRCCTSSALTESNLLLTSGAGGLIMNSPRPAHGITLDMKSESLQRLTTDVLLRKGPSTKSRSKTLPPGSKKEKNAPAPVNVSLLRLFNQVPLKKCVSDSHFSKKRSDSAMQEAGKKIIHAPNLKSYYVSQYSKAYDRIQRMKELESLRQVFKYADTDSSGNLDLMQFLSFMKSKEIQRIMATRFGFQPHQSEIIFRAVDSSCEGNINLEDWETYCTSRMESIHASGDGPTDFVITSCRETSTNKSNDTTKAAPRQPFKARPLRQYKSVVKPNDPNTTLHTSKWFFNLNPCQLPKCEKRSEC